GRRTPRRLVPGSRLKYQRCAARGVELGTRLGGAFHTITAAGSGTIEVGEYREDSPVVVGGGAETELVEDVSSVFADRALAEVQALGDRGVRPSLGHLFEHFALTRRDLVGRL